MATTQVTGLKIQGQERPLPIGEQEWGIHGPAQTRWVNFWVYIVLPAGTAILVLLVIAAFDVFDNPVPAPTVTQATGQPAVASNQTPPATTPAGPMTAETMKTALAEAADIVTASKKVTDAAASILPKPEPPPPAPTPAPAPAPTPPAPAKPPSIWDVNK